MNAASYFTFENSVFSYVVVDLAVVVALFVVYRLLSGWIGTAKHGAEPGEALSLAGGLIGIAIILRAVLGGDFAVDLVAELSLVFVSGLLGLVLMRVGRELQDRLVFTKINIKEAVLKGNMTAAIVDFSNSIATAILVGAALIWVSPTTWIGGFGVVLSFIMAQFVVALVARFRFEIFSIRNKGLGLEEAFLAGNEALGIRYMGHVIGAALAASASAAFVTYSQDDWMLTLFTWGLFVVFMVMLLSLLSFLAQKLVLIDMDLVSEVDVHKNIGVAAVEASIYCGLGLLLSSLLR
jgi:uncharacterized membrane protein YjfL (UPF0719 family)